ncbi:2,3-bisphosphoglycerate-independent phosphoglycerate mutase [soil metagenome]
MQDLIPSLVRKSDSKIVLLVLDGLGGVRTSSRGTELSEANTPNLDRMAAEGMSGVHTVVGPGITPGSGAGHMALFGYDPVQYLLGRGALSAAGVAFDRRAGDVAARVNFCTLDSDGRVIDRRAGRIPTEENMRLCKILRENVKMEGDVELFLETERDHRGLLVLRGMGLSAEIKDTDPGVFGITPNPPAARSNEAAGTAIIVQRFLDQVRLILAEEQANFMLLRGFDTLRPIEPFALRYLLKARGTASYPMYRGLSKLVGMDVSPETAGWEETVQDLKANWDRYDYFFLHQKPTDSAGEDGDYTRKIAAIEQVDRTIPEILALSPGVVCVTGDHSTPAAFMRHSWHPVPFLMWGENVGVDLVDRFDEESARLGGFGHQYAKDLMAFMLAATMRLGTYGA